MAKFTDYAALAAASVAAGDLFLVSDVSVPQSKKMTAATVLEGILSVSTGQMVLASNVFSFGPNGATNPAFQVNGATASAATGLKVTGAAAAAGLAVAVISSGTNEALTVDAKGSGSITIGATSTGNVVLGTTNKTLTVANSSGAVTIAAGGLTVTSGALVLTSGNATLTSGNLLLSAGTATVTSTSASALTVGANGATNPALQVDGSTASSATGVKVKSAAAAGGVAVSVISSGTDESLTLDAKGAGTITLNGTATGKVILGVATLQFPTAGKVVDTNGNELFVFPSTVASATNEFTVSNAANGSAPTITASGSSDTHVSIDLVPKGTTSVVRSRSMTVRKCTQTATTESTTLTIAQMLTGVIDGTPTGAASYALPTAANLVAGIANARVGDTFDFIINNKSGGANTITVTIGGATAIYGVATVAQSVCRRFTVVVTNVTGSSEAYYVYSN